MNEKIPRAAVTTGSYFAEESPVALAAVALLTQTFAVTKKAAKAQTGEARCMVRAPLPREAAALLILLLARARVFDADRPPPPSIARVGPWVCVPRTQKELLRAQGAPAAVLDMTRLSAKFWREGAKQCARLRVAGRQLYSIRRAAAASEITIVCSAGDVAPAGDVGPGTFKLALPLMNNPTLVSLEITGDFYEEVPSGFLGKFRALRKVRIEAACAARVRKIGDGFLAGCRALENLDVPVAWPCLEAIGSDFLADTGLECGDFHFPSLAALGPNFCSYGEVRTVAIRAPRLIQIGANFCKYADSLVTCELTAPAVVVVGGDFCGGCRRLQTLGLQLGGSLRHIGDYCLLGCVSLVSLSLPRGVAPPLEVGVTFISDSRGLDPEALDLSYLSAATFRSTAFRMLQTPGKPVTCAPRDPLFALPA